MDRTVDGQNARREISSRAPALSSSAAKRVVEPRLWHGGKVGRSQSGRADWRLPLESGLEELSHRDWWPERRLTLCITGRGAGH